MFGLPVVQTYVEARVVFCHTIEVKGVFAARIELYTFVYKNEAPCDFRRVLGVRCGVLASKGNQAKIKRYLINSFTLETILEIFRQVLI